VSYLLLTVERAGEVIETIPKAVRDAVFGLPVESCRQRPSPHVWSITYVCHLRDVYVTYTIRLHRTRTEEGPMLEPMLNDPRAQRFRYNERDLVATLDDLGAAVIGFGAESAHISRHDWGPIASRVGGEERTARVAGTAGDARGRAPPWRHLQHRGFDGAADRSDRGLDAGFGEPLGEPDRVYCEPLSVWCTTFFRSIDPSCWRVQMACSIASRTIAVAIVAATRQPRIRRVQASMTNAT
jgi:hypothetical protein